MQTGEQLNTGHNKFFTCEKYVFSKIVEKSHCVNIDTSKHCNNKRVHCEVEIVCDVTQATTRSLPPLASSYFVHTASL